jgi:predicted lysophospholipase L1 biosynthesis ABC-type transport system permease subunit
VVVSDNPTPEAFVAQAKSRWAWKARARCFPDHGRAPDAQGGASKLVALKAVTAGYPLRGSLQTSTTLDGAGRGHARHARRRRGVGRCLAARLAGPEGGRPAAAGRHAACAWAA